MNVSQQTFWFLRSNYKSQSKWACCEKSDGLSYDVLKEVSSFQSDLTHNIIRETTEVEKKKWIRIEFWRISESIAHLEYDLYFQTTRGLLLLWNDSRRKKYITINTIKLTFAKKTSSML